jgi:beta-xylosidase
MSSDSVISEYQQIMRHQSNQLTDTLKRWDDSLEKNIQLTLENRELKQKLAEKERMLTTVIESHERSIKVLKDDIYRRQQEEKNSIMLRVGSLDDVWQEVSRIPGIHADDIDRIAESCYDWLKDNIEDTLDEGYLTDSVNQWWAKEGVEEFFPESVTA